MDRELYLINKLSLFYLDLSLNVNRGFGEVHNIISGNVYLLIMQAIDQLLGDLKLVIGLGLLKLLDKQINDMFIAAKNVLPVSPIKIFAGCQLK